MDPKQCAEAGDDRMLSKMFPIYRQLLRQPDSLTVILSEGTADRRRGSAVTKTRTGILALPLTAYGAEQVQRPPQACFLIYKTEPNTSSRNE